MPEIVAVGECLIELYSDEPIGTASRFHRAYAGDTCNAALMAARLGSSCGYVTRMGDDPFADYLLAEIRKVGVDTSRVKRVVGFNGVHFISLLPDGDREFVYYRNGSAASTMTPDDLDADYIGSARVLHVSAILQATSPSARRTVLEAAQMARRLGVTVSYDTNLRLTLWSAEGRPRDGRGHPAVRRRRLRQPSLGDRGAARRRLRAGRHRAPAGARSQDRRREVRRRRLMGRDARPRRQGRRHRAAGRIGHDRRGRRLRGGRAARHRARMGAVRGRALGRRERGPEGRRQGRGGQPAVRRGGRKGRRPCRPDVAVARPASHLKPQTVSGLPCKRAPGPFGYPSSRRVQHDGESSGSGFAGLSGFPGLSGLAPILGIL